MMPNEKDFYESHKYKHVNTMDVNSLHPIAAVEHAISLSNKQKEDIKKCLNL